MNISISNIAWEPALNQSVAELLQRREVRGVDVAPGKLWPDPLQATDTDITDSISWWQQYDIQLIGMQSLHFGFPDLQLFGTPAQRAGLLQHTKQMIVLAGRLGIRALVFGSPKNRIKGALAWDEAVAIAVLFFQELGEAAVAANTKLCIEPNAADYGCDFVNTAAEGVQLVSAINHPGIGLHFDIGNMTMMGEDIAAGIINAKDWLYHFHVSEPQMAPVGQFGSTTQHQVAADTLRDIDYQGWVTIEMLLNDVTDPLPVIEQAVVTTKQFYF